ncbi:MAG: 3-dehydroquinate synthase [Candidatus Omnitrophota bacterium]|jgi:3-dehydroquinate synthase
MKNIKVALKQNGYDISVGLDILPKLGNAVKKLNIGHDAIVITNPVVRKCHGAAVVKSLKKSGFTVKVFEVPDGEASKSIKVAFDLMERVAAYDVLKQPFIVAVGGGVIGDLAGYIAAAYKRGIPYVHVPTSFLAQVDSSIGGKVGIDLKLGKNLVGAFYQPKLVFSDVSVLKTLPIKQIRNGLAEAIKYGVIYDKDLFEYIETNCTKLLSGDLKKLTHVVIRSSEIKAAVVVRDEKETKGVRVILNFGHTVGHAIEAAGAFKVYQHGEAIALGMRIVADMSVKLKLFTKKNEQRLNDLLTAVGLPEVVKRVKLVDVMKLMKHDKKFITGQNRFVLAQRFGKVTVVEGIKEDLIKASIKKYM